ncbi:unnamed protein product [Medioppia subpectinata]|uniref:Nas2 N-terminal domain-containing protein n=1 Tax=Medioppia subpectinata TaxID=1979941 RepID=A0A7R9PTC5_9ACAR|nr:unnamed protein product [Medioppia subpectinata]CAG2100488.1 unnamed protein product [Medioppia subpectinata]
MKWPTDTTDTPHLCTTAYHCLHNTHSTTSGSGAHFLADTTQRQSPQLMASLLMSSAADTQRQEVMRKELLDLNTQRNKMENEIKEWQSILDSQNVGLNEPLVDAQGFPRNDIDIHQIRIARNKIICLNNDYKNLMKQIEEKLFAFHELAKREDKPNDDNPEK